MIWQILNHKDTPVAVFFESKDKEKYLQEHLNEDKDMQRLRFRTILEILKDDEFSQNLASWIIASIDVFTQNFQQG